MTWLLSVSANGNEEPIDELNSATGNTEYSFDSSQSADENLASFGLGVGYQQQLLVDAGEIAGLRTEIARN